MSNHKFWNFLEQLVKDYPKTKQNEQGVSNGT